MKVCGEYEKEKLNSKDREIWYDNKKQDETLEDVITSAKGTEYIEKIFIEEGKLVLDGFGLTEQEIKWAEEIGIKVNYEKGAMLLLTSSQTEIFSKLNLKNEELVKEYEYTIYKVTGEGTEEEKKEEIENKVTNENEIIFTGLAQDKLYEELVKVRFKNSNKVLEIRDRIRTKEVEELVEIIQEPEAKTETGEINWTSENVIVTLSHPNIPENYKIQYRIGESKDWTTGNIVVEEIKNSTVVRGRLYNESLDDEVAVKTREISNIDKESPTKPAVEITQSTENSITVKASGSIDGLSGLKGYTFSIDKNKWEDVEAINGEASCTFNGIKGGTEVVVYVKAYDDIKVGKRNESEEASSSGTTTVPTISGLTLDLAGTYTNSYFKDSVTPKITYTSISENAYVLQYKLNGETKKDWTTVTSGTTLSAITANNTNIVFRLYNTSIQDEVVSGVTFALTINGESGPEIDSYQYNISNLDIDTPTAPTSVKVTAGVNSVTATASGSTDGTSGVLKYEYKTDNSEWQDSGTFSGIEAGVETTIYARAVDKVGHKSESKSNSGAPTVPTISGLTLDLSGTYKNSYFKDSVTPKVTYTSISTNAYVLQYKLNGETKKDWTTVTSGTTLSAITENNTNIVFRLYNTSIQDEVVSGVTFALTINGESGPEIDSYQYNISNLDTDTPTAPTTLNLSKSGNTITAKASGSTDGTSGVLKYQYSKDNSNWQDSGSFTELTYGSTYTIYARAVDKVEHTSSNKSNSITIDKLNGGVTLSATSGTVCVSASTKFKVSKNTSGGNLSVKSSNTAVATVSISETEVTIKGTSTAGTATITVTSAATSSYNEASATYTVTVVAHSATTGGSLKSSATCTEAAVYYHKCSRCGITLRTTYTSGSALGHDYSSKTTTSTYLKSSATCTAAATYYYKCSRCTAKGTSTYTSGNALGHDYSSKTTTSTYLKSSATCTAAATYYYKCSRCTAKGTSTYTSGSALGHNYVATELKDCSDTIKSKYKFNSITPRNSGYSNNTMAYTTSVSIGQIVYFASKSQASVYSTDAGYYRIASLYQSYSSSSAKYYNLTSLGTSYKINVCSRCKQEQ